MKEISATKIKMYAIFSEEVYYKPINKASAKELKANNCDIHLKEQY